jgi:hypothetical protein
MSKFTFEEVFDNKNAMIEREDGGCAMIGTISDNADVGMFVRIQSWDEGKEHKDFKSLLGKKIRVTIEVVEE